MTFMVNYEGMVFEKGLGAQTGQVAQSMTAFNPHQTWKKTAMGSP
jgi:hypothetical protein